MHLGEMEYFVTPQGGGGGKKGGIVNKNKHVRLIFFKQTSMLLEEIFLYQHMPCIVVMLLLPVPM